MSGRQGITAPAGFEAGTAAAGIKTAGADRLDCALLVSDRPAHIAGMFTTNRVKAAPVLWSQGVCIRGDARAVFVNSGNANACTGQHGQRATQDTAEAIAIKADIPITEVAILSTGVIGVPLPMERVLPGAEACVDGLSRDSGLDAARAIMTTDTVPKVAERRIETPHGAISLGGMAKGAGMIAPNMATMLALLTTDAACAPERLDALLRGAVANSFNAVSIDNDQSTNDAVLVLANGASGTPTLEAGTESHALFEEALQDLCIDLAQQLVRDGEGATKVIEIRVSGTASHADAHAIAKAIAQSYLVKTAAFGCDANWGRIACAAGYAGVDFEPAMLGIRINGVEVVHDGLPTTYAEADAAAAMAEKEIVIDVTCGSGAGHAAHWTSDLSYDYVRINADYRT